MLDKELFVEIKPGLSSYADTPAKVIIINVLEHKYWNNYGRFYFHIEALQTMLHMKLCLIACTNV